MQKTGLLVFVVTASLMLLLSACGGGGGDDNEGDFSRPIVGALPSDFPDDFPVYPGLTIDVTFPLAGRYVVDAQSGDSVDEIVAFYSEELNKGRWELLNTEENSDPRSVTIEFTAPGFAFPGIVLVAEISEESVKVGIAVPADAGQGE